MKGLDILFYIISTSTYISAAVSVYNYEKQTLLDDLSYRLPGDLIPTSYELQLTIDPEADNYTGTVKINFNVNEDQGTVHDIHLHADTEYITITSATANSKQCDAGESNDAKIISVTCADGVVGAGNVLSVDFTSKFPTDGRGLAKISYEDQGISKVLIESHFKPTYARRAFPSMDEPDLKASFSLSLTYPKQYVALSNAPVDTDYTDNSRFKTTKFATTPKISTYILSIFIAKFETALQDTDEKYKVSVFTRQDVANWTSEVFGSYYKKIIAELDDFTGVPYENLGDRECYQVASPDYYYDGDGDFGLFTYRESDLLDEGSRTTARTKQEIVMAVAYKLSHEWYGGDISTRWWSDAWANEAVATYLKYFIGHQVNEEFDLANQFVVEVMQKALQLDALPLTRSISSNESDVKTSTDIDNKLDDFNNLKGAAILHTINSVVGGDQKFKTAFQYHIAQRKGSDTDGKDLLMDLVEHEDTDVYSSLKKWIFSPGYPLVMVSLENDTTDFEIADITHKRFVYPIENMPSYDSDDWEIPLSMTTEGEKGFDKTADMFYTPAGLTFIYDVGEWVMFNMRGGSFYRVNYDLILWGRIINALKSDNRTEIHVLNRAQLVDDVFNIARIGDVSYELAFDLVDSLVDETEYYPWYSALNAFSYLLGKFEDYEIENGFKQYILTLIDKHVYIPNTLTSASHTSHTDLLRDIMILDWACYLGHFGCIAYTTEKFRLFKANQTSLEDYNLRGVIFCNGIRYSKNVRNDWEFLWDVYRASSSVQEQKDILNGLGCVEDLEQLQEYLLRTTNYSNIKRQDALLVFKSAFSSSFGLTATMEFLESDSDGVVYFHNEPNILSEMVYMVAERLLTDEHLVWLNKVIEKTGLRDNDDFVSKATVLASVNNYWKKHYQSEVESLFPAISTSSTTPTTTITTTNTPTITTTDTPPTTSTTTPVPTTTDSSCEKILISKLNVIFMFLVFLWW